MTRTKKKFTEAPISTANARSLDRKLKSLIDLFDNANLTVTIITETWLKENDNYNRIKEELLLGNDIDLISCNRTGNKRGGGVSIAFKRGLIKLEENKFGKDGFELVSAFGRFYKEKRIVVFYGVYLPPSLSKGKADRALEIINDNISLIKAKYESPVIYIAGDFNQFDINKSFDDHPDIEICPSPPTREVQPRTSKNSLLMHIQRFLKMTEQAVCLTICLSLQTTRFQVPIASK